MEVKEKSKKRELIKTIAIVFLVVMLVLTFFSNTFLNRSLPEVATQMVSSGTINARIRGSGTVSASESYEVILDQTREIRSVCVQVGQTVQQGDLLFVLGDVESQELKDAQEQLSSLNIEYQKKLLSLSQGYLQDDLAVKQLQEDLQKAIAERDANQVSEAELSYAKGDLAAAENELSQIGLILAELEALSTETEEYEAARAAVTEWEGIVSGYEQQLESLDISGDVDMDRKIEDAQDARDKAYSTWESNWLAHKGDLGSLISSIITYPIPNLDTNTNTPQSLSLDHQRYIDAYFADTVAADQTHKDAYDAVLKSQEDYQAAETTLRRLEEDYDISGSTYDRRREIETKLRDAQDELRAAQDALEAASGENSALKNQIKTYESIRRETDARVKTLEKTVTDLEAKKTAYEAAVELIAQKERELEEALSGKDIDKQLNDLDLQSMRLQIEKQQELVNKYQQESVGTEVTANVSGIVSAINVSAGKENTSGQAMAVIDVVDRGYTIRIPVTNQQAQQVRVGDEADITNYYWGNDLTAVLESIAPDPEKPGQGKVLVFRVTGEIDNGTTISLSVGQRSANYDAVIPKSALREDSNGHFVLVIVARNTPLGNRYIATRADVQVLAEDDVSAAVSGLSSNGDYVITTSSKPLDAGMQVRMVEDPA